MTPREKTLQLIVRRFLSRDEGRILWRDPVEWVDADRASLARFFAEAGFTTGAEIGVERGVYAETLLTDNPALTLYCVDAWRVYDQWRDHRTQAKVDGFFEEAKQRLSPFAGRVRFVREWSVDGARQFEDGSLDFVYIDANHRLEYVIADLAAWTPKVRAGGIIAGHDFSKRKDNGYEVHVVEALHAWTQAYHITPWFVIGGKEIIEGQRRDRPRSWCYVK